jgi:hypothetical protein
VKISEKEQRAPKDRVRFLHRNRSGASETKLIKPLMNAEIVSAFLDHRCSSQSSSDYQSGDK